MKLGDKLKQNFAKNLQNLRTQNDLTQARLADVLNDKYKDFEIDLQRTSIVNYEREGAMPKIDALYCIADYFGKTIDQIISPSMEKPVLSFHRMIQEAAGPVTTVNTERQSSSVQTNEVNLQELNIDNLLTTCVNGLLYRQFYVEVLKQVYQQLLENAGTEGTAKIETMFSKIFLGCLISKSKYLQNLAEKQLDEQQYDVFTAFQDNQATISMVANAKGLTEEEVICIFNTAQSKISSVIEENSKSNLS